MGSLKFFNLGAIKDLFNTPVFIETGLGYGHGLDYARSFPFDKLYSIEIDSRVIDASGPQFKDDARVSIIHGKSLDGLREIYKSLNVNAIHWLDSHFGGADLGFAGFGDEQDEDIRLPLITELELIRDERAAKGFKDVILMDDLMIFDDEQRYPSDDWKGKLDIRPRKYINSRDKILNILSATHQYEVYMEDSGFVIIAPK
jgi:hypothetical protein